MSEQFSSFQEPSVGQVSRVDVSGKVEVVWADNSKSSILPQVRSPTVKILPKPNSVTSNDEVKRRHPAAS